MRRVEFPVQPRQELQGLEDRSRVGQHGLHCLDRGPLGTFAKSPGQRREDRVLLALRESRSPRPPVPVAGLTRFPGPQISETRRLWHQLRAYDRITVPSLAAASLFRHCSERVRVTPNRTFTDWDDARFRFLRLAGFGISPQITTSSVFYHCSGLRQRGGSLLSLTSCPYFAALPSPGDADQPGEAGAKKKEGGGFGN